MRYAIFELKAGDIDMDRPVALIRIENDQGCIEQVLPAREGLVRELFEHPAAVREEGLYPAWSAAAVSATLNRLSSFNLGWVAETPRPGSS